jgi:hypothetical protein
VVQEPDAAVAHPAAVGFDAHDAGVAAEPAVFSSWRQYFAARFAKRKLADLRHLSSIVLQPLSNLCVHLAFDFSQLKVFLVRADYKLRRRLFVGHLNVPHNRPVKAFEDVLLSVLLPADIVESFYLLWVHEL